MSKKKITEKAVEEIDVSMPVTMKLEREVSDLKMEITDLSEAYMSSLSSIAEDNAKIKDDIRKIKNAADKVGLKYMIPQLKSETDTEYKERLKKCTPKYAHDGDIGMDMVAVGVDYDSVHDRYIYHTGFYCEAKKRLGMILTPRSSNSKTSAYICNTPGLVDPYQYRGEVMVVFKNRTSLSTRAQLDAMRRWNNMTWFQKLGKSYDLFEHRVLQEYLGRAMEFAPYEIGDRMCQMYILHCPEVVLKNVKKLSETERGEGGFGSTGK